MKHQCALCGREFTRVTSLDRHGRYCAKKNKTRSASPLGTSSSALQPEGSRKRAQHDDPSMIDGDGATDQVQGGSSKTEFHGQFDPGPSVSDMHEDSPPPTRSIRSGCVIRLPERFRDYLLFRDMSLDHVLLHTRASTPPESDDHTATPAAEESIDIDTHSHPFQTVTNKLGAFRRYTHRPTVPPKRFQMFWTF